MRRTNGDGDGESGAPCALLGLVGYGFIERSYARAHRKGELLAGHFTQRRHR